MYNFRKEKKRKKNSFEYEKNSLFLVYKENLINKKSII